LHSHSCRFRFCLNFHCSSSRHSYSLHEFLPERRRSGVGDIDRIMMAPPCVIVRWFCGPRAVAVVVDLLPVATWCCCLRRSYDFFISFWSFASGGAAGASLLQFRGERRRSRRESVAVPRRAEAQPARGCCSSASGGAAGASQGLGYWLRYGQAGCGQRCVQGHSGGTTVVSYSRNFLLGAGVEAGLGGSGGRGRLMFRGVLGPHQTIPLAA
jgi:hypothetical protein